MCIIVYKPIGVDFPSKNTLKVCFENNPDGAGYMFASDDEVTIKKGFMSFKKFWKSLKHSRKAVGDNKAFVMHFRIGTQGANCAEFTHPYPLSDDMEELKKTSNHADIGIAHNGIISLTSDGSKDYNDTMKFIVEYLALLIEGRSFYKHENIVRVINKLSGSKLAVLDGSGHCELMGNGWVTENGVYYSNDSFIEKWYSKYTWKNYTYGGYSYPSYFDDYDDEYNTTVGSSWDTVDKYYQYYDSDEGLYKFSPLDCPTITDGTNEYCDVCTHYRECYGVDPDWLIDDREFFASAD